MERKQPASLEQPGNKGSVEPVALVLAWVGLSLSSLLCKELLLLSVDGSLSSEQVGVLRADRGADTLSASPKLVTKDHDQVERDTNVTGNEGLVIPVAVLVLDKDVKVLEDGNEDGGDKSTVRSSSSEWGDESQLIVGNTLGLASANKVDVGDKDGDPGKDTEDGDHVDKVAKYNLGVGGDVHVGEETEKRRSSKSVDWDTTLIGSGEDSWGLSFLCEAEDGTGGNIEIRVASGEDEDENTGVENSWKVLDSGELDGDDEWRGGSRVGSSVGKGEILGIVWYEHAEEEDGENVEEEDTVEGELDGAWDGLAWVLSLSNSDTDQFSTEVGKGGSDHSGPDGNEATSMAFLEIWLDWSWVLPVLESLWFGIIWSSTANKNQRENQKGDNGDNLQT